MKTITNLCNININCNLHSSFRKINFTTRRRDRSHLLSLRTLLLLETEDPCCTYSAAKIETTKYWLLCRVLQLLTKTKKAFVLTAHDQNGPDLSAGSRKTAKRTFPWDLPVVEIRLALSQPQDEDEDIRETKRPRLEEIFSASTDEVTTENSPHDTWVAIPTEDAVAATDYHVDSDPVMDMAHRHWTPEEDEKLTSAVTNKRKKKRKKKSITNWEESAALVPDRTEVQCCNR
jgi:hypothetical protein